MHHALLFAIVCGLCVGGGLFAVWGPASLPVATRTGRIRTATVAGVIAGLVVLILPRLL